MKITGFFRRFSLYLILAVELICASNVKWGGQRWKEIIAFDGKGYYAYLPAIFIYNDLNFSFHDEIEKKYSSKNTFYEYRVQAGNGVIDKYFAGTALAELPFFLAAHVLTKLTGGIADGYSFIYQLCVSMAGIFYGLIGLIFLRKILRSYGFTENIITATILIIVFGTNLFYYTVFDPSQSHVYSFGIITAFIYKLKCYINDNQKKDLVLLGFLLGWIVLIRPVNGLIIFILPFLCGSYSTIKITLKNILIARWALLISLLVFLLTISIQAILYYFQSGNFINDSYVVESFIWNRPEIINILFSYKKGFFIYTPVAFIALSGLIFLFRKSKFTFWSFLLFFILISYVFSCWWSWWYGGSFSARPYTEFLSLFAILLAFTLTQLKTKFLKTCAFAVFAFCIILCQVQTYQFRYFIIHWEKMDKEHYWRVFMRIDQIINQENANADLLPGAEK